MNVRSALLVLAWTVACAMRAPAADQKVERAEEQAQVPPGAASGVGSEQEAEAEKSMSPQARPVSPSGAGMGGDDDESLDALLAELDRHEAELRERGVRLRTYRKGDRTDLVPRSTPKKTAPGDGRCARICDLASTVCDLKTRICTMAEAHGDDAKYGAACRRAERDCSRANEACEACDA